MERYAARRLSSVIGPANSKLRISSSNARTVKRTGGGSVFSPDCFLVEPVVLLESISHPVTHRILDLQPHLSRGT